LEGELPRWLLASSATPPGTVHRILGHASFATTMKLYGGLTAEALERAADTLGKAFESVQRG
jgi:integrase